MAASTELNTILRDAAKRPLLTGERIAFVPGMMVAHWWAQRRECAFAYPTAYGFHSRVSGPASPITGSVFGSGTSGMVFSA
jgi:hypothetical protein